MTAEQARCELCEGDGGEVLFSTAKFRVVLVDDDQYPGFCRVIWRDHVKEMTDLSVDERAIFMCAVWSVESTIRTVMQPEKINLACFGNMTPHLHWHVIPRYLDDAHFPQPVWGSVQQTTSPEALTARRALLSVLVPALQTALAQL
ncbi:HIT family protein [Glaciimonas immobilis]|uniref:Diadenosine tetraphosphate (Ap4A) HIT family hydrolase n=1 Tax=Glaciimonas immobilis TaxID=728004 RepID=A0A840RXK0_9BURK|nr:HIT family protein [Glaciimonas immobilis]KAF3998542.1 HIT family protein [Glaciimonas immobilis]MBB5201394.1 diadenosine tetraphosphate (Ap4A) HIT family hydrolase [Glaciimonas immobilis]